MWGTLSSMAVITGTLESVPHRFAAWRYEGPYGTIRRGSGRRIGSFHARLPRKVMQDAPSANETPAENEDHEDQAADFCWPVPGRRSARLPRQVDLSRHARARGNRPRLS